MDKALRERRQRRPFSAQRCRVRPMGGVAAGAMTGVLRNGRAPARGHAEACTDGVGFGRRANRYLSCEGGGVVREHVVALVIGDGAKRSAIGDPSWQGMHHGAPSRGVAGGFSGGRAARRNLTRWRRAFHCGRPVMGDAAEGPQGEGL